MAQPTVFKFGAGAFYLGDGAETEVFSKLCGFTSMDLEIGKDTNGSAVPDCDDPDAPIWATADVNSQNWKMSAEGFAAKDALPLIEAATFASSTRGVRFYIAGAGTGGATPDRLYAGKAHVTMKLSGKLGDKWQVSVDVTGSGPLSATSVATP